MSDRWSAQRRQAFSTRIKRICKDGAGNDAWRALDAKRAPEPAVKLRLSPDDVYGAPLGGGLGPCVGNYRNRGMK